MFNSETKMLAQHCGAIFALIIIMKIRLSQVGNSYFMTDGWVIFHILTQYWVCI